MLGHIVIVVGSDNNDRDDDNSNDDDNGGDDYSNSIFMDPILWHFLDRYCDPSSIAEKLDLNEVNYLALERLDLTENECLHGVNVQKMGYSS